MCAWNKRWTRALSVLMTVGLGCQTHEYNAEVSLTFGKIPRGVSDPCSEQGEDSSVFKSELDAVRLRVSGPGMKTMEKTFSSVDEIMMDKVPAGPNRNVLVSGLSNSATTWRGQVRGLTVETGKVTEAALLLTKVADLTCTRTSMPEGRAFATATQLNDGRILVTGGISADSAATDCAQGAVCRSLVATNTADVLDPTTGEFTPVGNMSSPRAFHTAAKLKDGRVVIIGGASLAKVDTSQPLPLVISPNAPISSIEIFNPSTNEFENYGSDPAGARTFAAGITLSDGRVLFSGGGEPNLWTDTGSGLILKGRNSSVICDSEGCFEGPTMAMRRFGHVMAQLDDGSVMVYGGSIETGTVRGNDDNGVARDVSRQAPEFFQDDQFFFDANRPSYIDGTGRDNNLFFGSAMRVKGFGLMIVGGILREDDSDQPNFTEPDEQAWYVEESVRFVSPGTDPGTCGDKNGVPRDDCTFKLEIPRFMAQAVPLQDGRRWVVGGGFSSRSGFQPSGALEFFPTSKGDVVFEQLTVGGVGRTMRQPRGGVTGVPMVAGTALFVGGSTTTDTGSRVSLSTAEIFTDSKEPAP
ncbi:MAG: kelch repeat-containing protein [Myxococcota bacterium]